MFTIATALVGLIGIVYVRRRFNRKKQSVNGSAA